MERTFWMVFVEGERLPAFKHWSLNSAEIEAKRLCENLGKEAVVLCSIKSFELNKFKTNDLRPDDDLPF